MKGFFGKILNIDVEKKKFFSEEIPSSVYENYLGGKGLCSWLLLKRNKPKVDPFSKENHFIIGTGCITDTTVLGSSRYGIYTKSPLTGIYSESYSGGKPASAISKTGYDAIIIKGKSDTPIYLEISDKGVEFKDATHLWGKGTFETEERIIKETDKKGAKAIVIGPAGENLVKYALIENDKWRSAGRTGVGAVLGSKKIKGIVFHGEAKREIADPSMLKEFVANSREKAKTDGAAKAYKRLGTPMMVSLLINFTSFPTKYWQQGTYEKWEEISGETLLERFSPTPKACPNCLFACGRYIQIKEGRHKGLVIEGPEYETIYAFGGLCLIDKLDEIAYLNHLCDDLGIDTITAGNIAGFAIEAAKRGKLSLEIDYGEVDKIADLIKKIVYREDVGDLLAEGVREVSKRLNLEDIAIHVKGLEPPGYDPRALKGMGLAYATSDRGACHLRTTFYKPEMAGISPPDKLDDKAKIFVDYEDKLNIFDTFILCRFFRDFYDFNDFSTILKATTGMKFTEDDLRKISANIQNTTRSFNLREGITKKDDTLPKRFFEEPQKDSGKVFKREDFEKLLDEYYELRNWSKEGIPKDPLP
ncbi:MAG: aldehyde:ferredoxin oxidoreductase [Deltaproteobacteria bacterium]|nr:MAG: aldehyde:ferredoxin oxidoreductase [Deltaproteobacteria bacterium]